MNTSTNPVKPRSQLSRYAWLRNEGVLVEGHGFFRGKALDEFVDRRIYEDNERAKAQRKLREEENRDVPTE